ncbi:MAG: hypothetical protein NVS9B10_06120 [Nevskia sp.]
MSPSLLDALGYVAASFTTFSFVPQAWRVWRSRSADDISTPMYVIFLIGVLLWLAYGIVLNATPIIAANCVTLVLAGAVLGMKWRYARRGPA